MILTGETEVLGEKHYRAWLAGGWMSMEQWWNGTDRGNCSMGTETVADALCPHGKVGDRIRTSAVKLEA